MATRPPTRSSRSPGRGNIDPVEPILVRESANVSLHLILMQRTVLSRNELDHLLKQASKQGVGLESLLERQIPQNIVCTWSLGTDTVIQNEEPGTAPLDRRLAAARRASDHGIAIGFHFHPMIYYQDWKQDYSRIVHYLLDNFDRQEVSFISMGAVTLIRPVEREIRRRGGETKILQMEMVQDAHGKLTYPDAVKIELFSHLFSCFEPWHEEVFFYLCMENAQIWDRALGFSYPTNRQFEDDFLDRCLATEGCHSVIPS